MRKRTTTLHNIRRKDNQSILALMGHSNESEWPTAHIWKADLTMWKDDLTTMVEAEMGSNWKSHVEASAAFYGQPGGLKKNPLAVSRALESAWKSGDKSPSLEKLANNIIEFAESSAG
jgi:hypothetical protein